MLRPLVRLVVLNYNGGDMTLRCLEHLERLDWPAERLQLVLVDNASSDHVVETVQDRHPRVRVIQSGANLGFPANNLGLADRDAVDYAGLVNNDAFVEPAWLGALVDALEADPRVGAATSKVVFEPRFVSVHLSSATFRPGGADPRELGVQILGVRVAGEERWRGAQLVGGCHAIEPGPDGPFCWTSATGEVRVPLPGGEVGSGEVELRLRAPSPTEVEVRSGRHRRTLKVGADAAWHRVEVDGPVYDVVNNVGSVVFTDGYSADRGYLEPDAGQYERSEDVFAWCGASVLFRRRYLDEVGLFEPRFFLYYEDTDLSWRGRAAGWRHRYVPTSRIRHVHAATSVEGSPVFAHHVERNRLLLLARNAPAGMALRESVRFLLVTASYARRDIVGPLRRRRRPSAIVVRRRLGSFLAYVRLLPWTSRERRRLRARQVVPDRELLAELVQR